MSSRKIPDQHKDVEMVTGYLSTLETSDRNYGYPKNHLPETSGKARSVPSVFDQIQK